ncbi:ABC transporter permease subunit [Paenibacillus sp. LMG 31458]|uniref:ABC transporter permease subunit n=1 Tax=Paenibacillus phytorum TaxID=2654977 RepID=A0ABX1Y1L4_9BACL|nr:ABC transporter permease subunit [Paenibacillus phytorum]NOU74740.1 ABC transporter permease subunit [Paenibacillus phytorum]
MEAQSQKLPVIAQTDSKPRSAFTKELFKNYDLYLLLAPGVIFFFVFCYIPMFGLVIAFKDYNIFKGVFDSDWVGLQHFKDMLQIQDFYRIVRNTLLLNVLGLIVGFPAPIILALMLNEIRAKYFKKISQSLLYLPHFMSWVIMGGIIYNLLSPKYGIVNDLMRFMGMKEIYFMIEETWWVITYTLSSVWAGAGWGTIIYLAAMTTIDPSLYEAAVMDGAGRWKKIVHITLPGIMPTIIVLLILNIGHMVSIGVEHPFALQNPVVTNISDVISTYVYSAGIKQGQFGITTAIGMSQSFINLILVLGANYFAKRFGKEGLW